MSAGEFRDYAGCLYYLTAHLNHLRIPATFSPVQSPLGKATPPPHTHTHIVQDGQYILLNTELICHQIISVNDIQTLGNRIFTAIRINKGATKPNMHGVSL